jgi:xanthine dehydrogenase small subunit
MTRSSITFLLNGDEVTVSEPRAEETLLDFLRIRRALRGTKEGCAEGDCGACTVVVGRRTGQGLAYEGVNACIRFLASLDRTHVVTVEHLKRPDGSLHPIQQSLVEEHGAQCGFCTPGFVMSLYGLWMRVPEPTEGELEKALQGNLCRCTGYEPIVRAAMGAIRHGSPLADALVVEREAVAARLAAMDASRIETDAVIVPATADDLAAVLAARPGATIVAGATDVGLWVTKRMSDIAPAVFIGHLEELRRVEEHDGRIRIGAGVSYTDAFEALAERIPALGRLIYRIGGEQVRNMGTIGGNVANGSPIGDMPPALIALDARLTLRGGDTRRTIPLEEFFIDYGRQDRRPGEFVEAIEVPLPDAGEHFAVHKVTKRRDEDITAVLSAFRLRLTGDGRVEAIRIACGGMAGVPKRAKAVEAALLGRAWTTENVAAALPEFEVDFTPLTDMRASAEYRMLVAKNLLRRFFLETTGTRKPIMVTRERAA